MDASITHIRPRFKIVVPHTQDTLRQRLKHLLANPPANVRGKMVDDHIFLDIIGEDVHYWSPQLNFRLEPDEDNSDHTIVAGLIGPRPNVWTLFVFIYFSIGIAGLFVSTIGVSRWLLGEYSLYLLAFPLTVLFMLTAYAAGKYGERLGADQVEVLKNFVREVIQ